MSYSPPWKIQRRSSGCRGPGEVGVAIREEGGLSRAAYLKRLMGAFFLALVLILTGACGVGGFMSLGNLRQEAV